MNHMYHPTIAQLLWPVTSRPVQRAAVLAVAGAVLLTISAKIQIPFYPVPVTMQTLVVMLLGMAYGTKLGTASVFLYLAAGAAGMPVFAGTPEKGIGLAYMLGPTGGYLLGFVLAAALCGELARRGWDKNIVLTALAMFAGTALIYVPGLLWLGNVVGWDKPVLAWGLYPFIIGDLFKLALAAGALPPLSRALRRSS